MTHTQTRGAALPAPPRGRGLQIRGAASLARSHRRAQQAPSTRYLVLRALGILFVAVVAVTHFLRPSQGTYNLALITLLGTSLVFAFGTWYRGLRTPLLGGAIVATGLSLFVSNIANYGQPQFGAAGFNGLGYILGFSFFGLWFYGLHRRLDLAVPHSLLINTALAATSLLIALWSIPTPSSMRPALETAYWTFYPSLSAVGASLTWHIARRYGHNIPAFRWLLAGMISELVIDLGFAVRWLAFDIEPHAYHNAVFLLPYTLFAVASSHPSLSLLRPGWTPEAEPRRHPSSTLAYLLIFPAYASLLIPPGDGHDRAIRYALVGVLLSILLTHLLFSIHELRRMEEQSARRAIHDHLTGLLNRSGLFEELSHRLNNCPHRDTTVALYFLDCDHFKHVNDTWGHHAGDTLLRNVAKRLTGAVREDDIVARHGGDEFIVVARLKRPEDAPVVAQRLRDHLARPIEILPGRTHRLSVSIGIAFARPGDADDPVRLIGRADSALYEAKAKGRGRYLVWDDALADKVARRTRLHQALRTAVADERIGIHLQPIRTGHSYHHTHGYEALARWTDPELGTIDPDTFIPIAEELEIIDQLGDSVLRQACQALADLRAAGHEVGAIFVNLSPLQLDHPGFERRLISILEHTSTRPGDLWLEITETALVSSDTAFETLFRLRAIGVNICLDDFGTGYASLTSLRLLPLDCVKLDRALLFSTAGHTNDTTGSVDSDDYGSSRALYQHLIDVFALFGIHHVVAEGVETAEHARLLHDVGCPHAQGFWFAHPAPLEHWLNRPAPTPAHAIVQALPHAVGDYDTSPTT